MNTSSAIDFKSGASWGKFFTQPASVWLDAQPIRAPTPAAGQVAQNVSRQADYFFTHHAEEYLKRAHNAPMWLEDIYSLIAQRKIDEAIDILFKNVNEMLCKNEFILCNDLLRTVDLKRLDTNLLVGFLTITLPASTELPFRATLVKRIDEKLRALAPERAERILNGLR